MRYLWIDTETTGIKTDDSGMFQLAMILVDKGKAIAERCFFLNPLNEKIKYHESAGDIHGYSEKDILVFPPEKEQVEKIANFFYEARELWKKDGSKTELMTFAGYNVSFDIKHLKATFERNGYKLENYFNSGIIADVFEQVKKAQKMKIIPFLPNRKLGTVCEHFGINLKNAHDALADINATRELAKKLHLLGATLV